MNGRGARRRRDRTKADRDGTGFIALPHVVVDSPAWAKLTWPARGLLIELARQYRPGRNGQLLATTKVLGPRGFNSNETITRMLAELEQVGFIYRTCRGGRPARASLYALTWHALDAPRELFDHDPTRLFRRGAYLRQPQSENAALIPTIGSANAHVAPMVGARSGPSTAPCTDGRFSGALFLASAAPIIGDPLEKPSVAQRAASAGAS
jgi:hypothetical protein